MYLCGVTTTTTYKDIQPAPLECVVASLGGCTFSPMSANIQISSEIAKPYVDYAASVIVSKSYNGYEVELTKNENGIVYVNLTEVAKAFPNKNLTSIVNSQEIKEYCETLSKLKNFSLADLLIVKRGGSDNGTWAHQKVALRVAQKLSPEFAIMVDTWIEELLTTGQTQLQPLTQGQMLVQMATREWLPRNERRVLQYAKSTLH